MSLRCGMLATKRENQKREKFLFTLNRKILSLVASTTKRSIRLCDVIFIYISFTRKEFPFI